MSLGIVVNENGSIEFGNIKAPIRNKGKNLIPSIAMGGLKYNYT